MSVISKSFRSWRNTIGAVLAGAAVIASPLVAPAAVAAENPNIEMTVTSFTKTDVTNTPQPGGLAVNDLARLDVAWDATNANPQPGDSFKIQLPPALETRDSTTVVDLIHKNVKAGECATETKAVRCTLNDKIRGKIEIKGTFFVALVVRELSQETELPFVLSTGKTLNVGLPENKPIAPSTGGGYQDLQFHKSTVPLSAKTKELVWTLDLGTTAIKEGAAAVTLDGTTPYTLTVRDQLGEGLKFDTTLAKTYLLVGTSQANPSAKPLRLVSTDGTKNPEAATHGDFTVTAAFQDQRNATFTITGPFKPDTNYHLIYSTNPTTADGFIQKDHTYTNTANLENTTITHTSSREYSDSLGATIQIRDGYGKLALTKKVTGAAAAQVPDDKQYTVEVHWTLPEGKTAADYDGWTAPANPVLITIPKDVKTVYSGQFPFGTALTLKEPNKPAITGIEWGEAQIQVDNGAPVSSQASMEIVNQHVIDVVLTNTATKAKGQFAIKKTLAGDAVTLPANYVFPFTYVCTSGASGDLAVPADGTIKLGPKLDHGDTCTITEGDPTADASVANYNLTKPAAQQVIIGADTATTPLTFVNTYAISKGVVKVEKVVKAPAGDTAFVAPKNVTVEYTVNGVVAKKEIAVGAGAVELGTFDAGAAVVVTGESDAEVKGYSMKTEISAPVTVAKDGTHVITVTNTYTCLLYTSPSPRDQRGSRMPSSA